MINKEVEVMKLRDSGLSIREIASKLDINRGSVDYILKKQKSVIESVIKDKDIVIKDTVIKKKIMTKEDIYNIPIVKLFKWKFTEIEEEEILNTGKLIRNGFNIIRT